MQLKLTKLKPSPLNEPALSPVEKSLQVRAAQSAHNALKDRVDKQAAYGRALSFGYMPNFY